MLYHRTGTKFEDLAFIDSKTGEAMLNKAFDRENSAIPNEKMKKMLRETEPYTIIAMHNHPGSTGSSFPDIMACVTRKYKYGLVMCHDGKIYKYAVNAEKFNSAIAISALAKLEKVGYNDELKRMFEDSGIEFEVI